MAKSQIPIEGIAEYTSALTVASLPPEIIELAKLKILDSVACAYLGDGSDATKVAISTGARLAKGPCATLLSTLRLGATDAAFVNSAAVHAILQDDVDLAIGHPGCNVIPAALAIAEITNATGADLVAAIVAGYETMWRVGGCGTFMVPTIARGFRGNTLLGTFGAASTAARLLRLDAKQTANAIGAAASFTAGLLRPLNVGSLERSFQQAANTQHGVLAALLAADGLPGCVDVLQGFGGLYQTFMGQDAFPADGLRSLGTEFHMPKTFAKPYPSAGSNTVGIAVLDHLLKVASVSGDQIAEMLVEVVPRFTGKPGYPAIANPGPFENLEHALISFPFDLACLAILGTVTLPSLRQALKMPAVSALAARITLKGVEVPYPLWCRITVTDRHGRRHAATADEIKWSHFFLDRPTASEKYLAAVSGRPKARAFLSATLDLDKSPSARDLPSLLAA